MKKKYILTKEANTIFVEKIRAMINCVLDTVNEEGDNLLDILDQFQKISEIRYAVLSQMVTIHESSLNTDEKQEIYEMLFPLLKEVKNIGSDFDSVIQDEMDSMIPEEEKQSRKDMEDMLREDDFRRNNYLQ